MDIRRDDLSGPEIRALLEEYLRSMYEISPPESVHALDLNGLQQPDVTFWTIWSGAELLGCGACKRIDARRGEIKSMRTAALHRGKGVAQTLLAHIVHEARRAGYTTLSLETGVQPEFAPARRLYERFGFRYTGPFANYALDPLSAFMSKDLTQTEALATAGAATVGDPSRGKPATAAPGRALS